MGRPSDIRTIAAADGRYPPEAFQFVAEALGRAADLFGKRDATGPARHLSADELVTGAVDLAAERWSLLGDLVLERWNIRSPQDVGEITFVLIEHGVFSKDADDRLEDFHASAPLAVGLERRMRQRVLR